MKRSLIDVGVLGIPFRYSLKIADMMKVIEKFKTGNNIRDAVILAMCAETRLPILTSNESRYKELAKKFKVKIIEKSINSATKEISGALNSGVYMVSVESNGAKTTQKVVIK